MLKLRAMPMGAMTPVFAIHLHSHVFPHIVIESGHPLQGECVAGRVVVCRSGKGSTAGSFSLLQLSQRGLAPAAIVSVQADAVVTAGCVIAGIPLVHRLDTDIAALPDGAVLAVDGDAGTVEVLACG